MSLNPTAPAFSPPESIPRVASEPGLISTWSTPSADSDRDLPDFLHLDLDLDLALDVNQNNPTLAVLEATKLASALLGESLLKALLQSPVADGPHNDGDGCDASFPSSPLSQCSLKSTDCDVWSPTSDYFATASSTPDTTYSLLTSDLPRPDDGLCCEALSPASSSNDTWTWDDETPNEPQDVPIPRPEAVSYTETCGLALNTVVTTSLDGATYLAVQQQPWTWQQQDDFIEDGKAAVPQFSGLGYPFQPQFLIIPPSPRLLIDTLPSSKSTARGLAPLWPLLSALQRNLSRSRPDLYGSLPTLASPCTGTVGPAGACG